MTDQDVRDFLERMAAEEPVQFLGAEPLTRRARRRAARTVAVGAVGVAAAIAVLFAGAVQLREASPTLPAIDPTPSGPIPTPALTEPVRGEPVLYLQSWIKTDPRPEYRYVELAVYVDGQVIWNLPSEPDSYVQMRLTPEGVERLRARAVSTGLFERDLDLRLPLRWGQMEVRRGDRSVIVEWDMTRGCRAAACQDPLVDATSEAGELIELEAFFRDPVAWGLPNDIYVQPEASPFVPTHLWVSWDRGEPDPSELPSPAREVLTRNLKTVLRGGCEVISIAKADEIARAMERAGLIEPDDPRDGIAFSMPGLGGGTSFLHAHPSLPHGSTCNDEK